MPYVIHSFGAPVFYTVAVTPPPSNAVISLEHLPLVAQRYLGTGGMVPIAIPDAPYAISGQQIDTPLVCTAPMTAGMSTIPVGSTFLLLFVSPSSTAQSLLVSGSTLNMTFGLLDGDMVTGPVSLLVTQSSLWIVLCTVAAPIPIQRS